MAEDAEEEEAPKKRIRISRNQQRKNSYKTLYQLYTILMSHDESGKPGKLLIAAQNEDWESDKTLIKYRKQIREGKVLIPMIKTQLKYLKNVIR